MFQSPTRLLNIVRPAYNHLRTASQARHLTKSHSFGANNLTMAAITKWDRLIRYVSAKDGQIRYGEPLVSDSKPDIDQLAQDGTLTVKILEGATPFLAEPTGAQDQVKHLLGPLTPKDVPVVRCTGLNYKTHSECPISPPQQTSTTTIYIVI